MDAIMTRKRKPARTPRTGRPPLHPADTQQRRIIITLDDAQWAELCELMHADTHARGKQILTALRGATTQENRNDAHGMG